MESVEGRPVPVGALDVTMHRDDLRRQPTRSPMHTSIPPGGIDDRVVVLVDDVLYSGRTVRAALDLGVSPAGIENERALGIGAIELLLLAVWSRGFI